MVQALPFTFEPSAAEYEDAHLRYTAAKGGRYVRWDIIGIDLFVPDMDRFSLSLFEIEAANRGSFTVHGDRGFSVGKYHEFFVHTPPRGVRAYSMGGVEATFGDATPLAAFLFEGIRSKWNGEWDDISSVRILGAEHDEAEVALINSLMRYSEQTGFWPTPFQLGEPDWPDDEDQNADQPLHQDTGPMITNLEPLRFLNSGVLQDDDTAACVYFYRVIEYFAFFTTLADLSKLRRDPAISDVEFARKMLDLVARDEKGPILRTINSLADDAVLSLAAEARLVGRKSSEALGEEIYSFRNSIVHGKYASGFILKSGSAIHADEVASKWRVVLLRLAKKALSQFGVTRT